MAYKDGFVIEYANGGKRVSCYKCAYFNKRDKGCDKTGVFVPDVAYEKWKLCAFFELDDDFNTEEMRLKAIRGRELAQKKKQQLREKRQSQIRRMQAVKATPPVEKKEQSVGHHPAHEADESIPGVIAVGTRVRSPKYGKGKIVGIEGKWATVAFVRGAKRVRFDVEVALAKGSLEFR